METNKLYKIYKNTKFNIIILCILCILIFFIIFRFLKENNNTFTFNKTKKESFDCTLHINDIDPKHIDNYMKYDKTRARCGICNNSILRVNIKSTCPTDASTGSTLINCKQQGNITSSYGIPIVFNNVLSPDNINNFFCPSAQFTLTPTTTTTPTPTPTPTSIS